MGFYETLTLVLAFLSVILIPTLVLLIRGAVSWSRVEMDLRNVVDDVRQLVADKDKVHREIIEQMREDRNATNARLRWLETNLWNRRRRGEDVS